MSTDDDQPTATAVATVPAEPGAPYLGSAEAPGEEPEPGWFDRNATLVIAVSVAVIAAAAALVTLFFYRESMAEADEDTEAAVRAFVEEQGQDVESVQCDEGTCSAIVGGAAYTVLVHEDEDGEQTFGVAAYTGD
ncbi:hypothetical protein [Blastococcus sp. SYSU D01042]